MKHITRLFEVLFLVLKSLLLSPIIVIILWSHKGTAGWKSLNTSRIDWWIQIKYKTKKYYFIILLKIWDTDIMQSIYVHASIYCSSGTFRVLDPEI